MPPNVATLQRLQRLIQRTTSGIPKIQDEAIETGDFTELRRAQGVIKQLSGIADRLTSQQQEPPPAPNVTPAPAPTPAPPPKPSLQDLLNAPPSTTPKSEPSVPPLTPRDPTTGRPTSGSLRDLIDIEIPHAIRELGKIGGYFTGESGETIQPYRPAPPTELGEVPSHPIQAPKPPSKPPPEVMPTGGMTIQDLIDRGVGKPPGVRSLAPAPPPSPQQPQEGPSAADDITLGPLNKNPFETLAFTPEGYRALQEVEKKARELGETPTSMVESIEAMPSEGPEDDVEKEFLARVKMLGLDRRVPSWERFITALAYGAANIFSRWVSRNWRMPLNFPDLMAQDRRDDETRRQLALQLLSERAAEKRQTASLKAMGERQKETHAARIKIAEIQAAGKAKRKTAQDELKEASQYYDLLSKMDRVAAEPFEREIDSIVGQIKAADDWLRTRGVGTGIPGEYKYNPEDITAHQERVDPLNSKLTELKNRLAETVKSIRAQNPR